MKKLIPLLLAALCLTSCAEQKEIENPDTLRAAVIGSSDSVSARNAYSLLGESTAAALTVDMIDMSDPSALSEYDIFYIDKSAVDLPSFDAKVIEPLVSDGGASAVLDNELYNYFDYDFVGASEFVSVNGCPVDMEYPAADRDTQKIQELISDFCKLYKNYSDFDTLSQLDYGVGVVPSTAQCIAVKDGAGIYTINQYGNGYVFFTNPLLPNIFSVNNLSPEDKGEYLSATTVGANKLLRDYIAEFVSMKKYGYSTELIIGNYGSPAASWECHYEDITGIENGSAEIFEEMCENYGQVPSFTLVRNPYVWFRRAESVTYAVNDNGAFAMDPYENAYSSGTHFVSSKKWLSLAYDDNTISYFLESPDYTKRAYPCPVDFNGDGVMDLICGSSDGVLYYYEGYGMKTNYELSASTVFTNGEGDPISVGEYSSPQTADINLDGEDEIICGSAEGLIRCFARTDKDSMVLEDLGVIINTGLVDSMPAAGDLNGDGMTDIAVGSRGGDLRIYYGTLGVYGVEYNDFVTVESGQPFYAPCIADTDGNGFAELYAGTFDGYIIRYAPDLTFDGYIEGNECNYKGNTHLKFGTNCVPRFFDINGDGAADLIAGSLEYGMAVPIDSEYFPYGEKLRSQLDGFKERDIYVGVHSLSHEYADAFHDERELAYHKAAFEFYGLPFEGNGANQHTWRTSKIGYDTHYDNTTGYDGTYRAQMEAGLYWNSGSQTPDSTAVPEVSAENAIPIPFYLNNGQLMLQPCNTPNGNSIYSNIAAKYFSPLLFYNHCDYVYADRQAEDEKIKKADAIVNDYGYIFVQEDQLAKMTAAAYNTRVDAVWENNGLSLRAVPEKTDIPLYDKNYQDAVGVKITLADGVLAEEFCVDADVYYKRSNCIFVSLTNGARISKTSSSNDINIMSVNLPAKISKNDKGARIRFLDGGMMSVCVSGAAKTDSKGWETTQQNNMTIFRKYGKADTLNIKL